MLERLLILLAIAGLVAAGWALWRAAQARRLRALADRRPLAAIVPPGRPAVVAFTLPGCADCRARQAPALRRLAASLGDRADIRTLTASDHPAVVDQLGLMTVPATVVLDASGAVRHLNQGFADEARLSQQLAAL